MSTGEFSDDPASGERPIEIVRGTRDRLPREFARLASLEAFLLERFARAGHEPLRTPALEPIELHERKSGAAITSKLFEISGLGSGRGGVCLRPELTAGIVRAYTEAQPAPATPWRVSHAGSVFRHETPRPDRLREFEQVGVERIGDGGPLADAEIIWLAAWSLGEAGVRDVSIRLGHVGLILEMLRRSGLPAPLGAALIERLSEAAAEGQGIHALEAALAQVDDWIGSVRTAEIEIPDAVDRAGEAAIDRLYRTLVPVVTGRRSGREIVHRLRRKWDLSHGLLGALERVRDHVHELARLRGRPDDVLGRLGPEASALAPDSIAALRALTETLAGFGIPPEHVELDLGFGRGIGFYSEVVFELTAPLPDGTRVELGGGGRYDGLARVLGSDRDDRGVGFAFGLERVAATLDAQGRPLDTPAPAKALVIVANDPTKAIHAARLAGILRGKGARVLLDSGRAVEQVFEAGPPGQVLLVGGPPEEPNQMWLMGPKSTNDTIQGVNLDDLIRLVVPGAGASAGAGAGAGGRP